MVSVSTFAFAGLDLLEFAEKLRRQGDTETGLELFFDTHPFTGAGLYQEHLRDFINHERMGIHCPTSGCDLLADEGTLLLRHSLDRHKECMELAARINAPYMVLHTNGMNPVDQARIQKKRKLFMERAVLLAETARQYGCELWVENVGFGRSRTMVFDEASYIDLILSGRSFYSLVDIGHAHINGWDLPRLFKRLNGRIKGIHVHDNDGVSDQHLPVFRGNIQWEPIFQAIQNLSGDLVAVLEYMPNTPRGELSLGINILRDNLFKQADTTSYFKKDSKAKA